MTPKTDEDLYRLATEELNSKQRKSDLWARACALATDDVDEARYLYTNLRVEELAREHSIDLAGTPAATEPPADLAFLETVDLDSQLAAEQQGWSNNSAVVVPDDDALSLDEIEQVVDSGNPDIASRQSFTGVPNAGAKPKSDVLDFDAIESFYDDVDDSSPPAQQATAPVETANASNGTASMEEFIADFDTDHDGKTPAQIAMSRLQALDDSGALSSRSAADPGIEELQSDAPVHSDDELALGLTLDDNSGALQLDAASLGDVETAPAVMPSISPDEAVDAAPADTLSLLSDEAAGAAAPLNTELTLDADDDVPVAPGAAASVAADVPGETVSQMGMDDVMAGALDDDGLEHDATIPVSMDHITGAEGAPAEVTAAIDSLPDRVDNTSSVEHDDTRSVAMLDTSAHEQAYVPLQQHVDESGLDPAVVRSMVGVRVGDDWFVPREDYEKMRAELSRKSGTQPAYTNAAEQPTLQEEISDIPDEEESQARRWYNIYADQGGRVKAVKQGGSLLAMLATLPWLLYRGMIGTAVVYALMLTAVVAALLVMGLHILDSGTPVDPIDLAVTGVFAILALVGLFYLPWRFANNWIAKKLEARGFEYSRSIKANSIKHALKIAGQPA